MKKLINRNVESSLALPTPETIKAELPMQELHQEKVLGYRQSIENILDRHDDRLLGIVGPCSIHDPKQAMEYAQKLKALSEKVQDQIFLVMRVYFEKPRTTIGWKGLINDPRMDDSFHIEEGIRIARNLLLDICDLGLPTGTEALDPIIPQYIGDLISWTAIGARTTESQTHREMSSGLSTPIGFKNGTDGGIQVAINAMKSAIGSHAFLGINQAGQIATFKTKGNAYGHVVLRGGKEPNYDSESIKAVVAELNKNSLPTNVVVDCSHANSNKDFALQGPVFESVIEQRKSGNQDIIGFMLESNLEEGSQAIPEDLSQLRKGVSVTDQCISWGTTEKIILAAAEKLRH